MTKKKIRSWLSLCTIFILSVLLFCGCSVDKNTSPKENIAAPQTSENAIRDSYDIQLTLDTDEKEINGSVKIKLTNTSQDTWSQLCFRDYISAIGQIYNEMNGSKSSITSEFTSISNTSTKEELDYSRTNENSSVLFVVLKTPLAPGESTEIQFNYNAPIPEDAFRYRFTKVNEGKNSLFELANFYPILAIYENGDWQYDSFYYEGECFYSKCADYSITLSLPEEYIVVSSGTEEKISTKNGVSTWTMKAENMRDIGLTASDYFAFSEKVFEDIQIRCYYFDNETAKKQAKLMLGTTMNSVEFFTQNIGGYPYQTLDVVMTNDLIGAIEFPTYVRVGDYSADMEGDNSDYITDLIIENTSHEVAHQWFYAVIGNNCYEEPWLDESFASFCALAYQSKDLSQQDLETLVSQGKSYLSENNAGYLNLSYNELGKDYLTTVYQKGKYFLYDLMNAMGKDTFYKMLQEYYNTYAFQETTTKDFIDILHKYTYNQKVKELIETNLRK